MTKVCPAMTALLATTILNAGLVACDRAPAVGPSGVPNPRSTEPARPQVRLTGLVVDANDRPVSGAQIAVWNSDGRTSVETVADTAGAYALTIEKQEMVEVDVQKDGFELSRLLVWLPGAAPGSEVTRNLRLHGILRISAGESVELSIAEDDSICYDLEGWPCRRVRVVSPVAGQLTLEVPPESVRPYALIELPGPPYYDIRSFFRLTVAAGSETIVDVMAYGGKAPMTTTLTTRFEP